MGACIPWQTRLAFVSYRLRRAENLAFFVSFGRPISMPCYMHTAPSASAPPMLAALVPLLLLLPLSASRSLCLGIGVVLVLVLDNDGVAPVQLVLPPPVGGDHPAAAGADDAAAILHGLAEYVLPPLLEEDGRLVVEQPPHGLGGPPPPGVGVGDVVGDGVARSRADLGEGGLGRGLPPPLGGGAQAQGLQQRREAVRRIALVVRTSEAEEVGRPFSLL